MILACQYLQLYDNKEDVGYVEPTKIWAFISPTLPLVLKFDKTSDIIKLLNLKGVFVGLSMNDENYLANFIRIYTFYTIPGVDQVALRLRLFFFSLTRMVLLWFRELS